MYSPCCSPVVYNPCTTINTVPCPGGDPCTTQPVGCQNVVYNGPTLPCTQIKNCDTLCIALQKVDEQICDLKDQILVLQEALDKCCNTTTTTTTSTSSSSTSTTSTSSTSSTSTTSTSSSTTSTSSTSTTSTTTTQCPCVISITIGVTEPGMLTYQDCCNATFNQEYPLLGAFTISSLNGIKVSSLVASGGLEFNIISVGLCTTPNCTTTTTSTSSSTSTTTSTSTSSTTTTSTSSTTTTTTTSFACVDCRNWQYSNVPPSGDVISYYSCVDGSLQSIVVSEGQTGEFCNCNSIGIPTGGTTLLTEVGFCSTTTTTTFPPPTTTTTTTLQVGSMFFDGSVGICGYYITAIDVNGVTPTLVSGTDVPFCTDGHTYNTNQLGINETINITIGNYAVNGCITILDSNSNPFQQNVTGNGLLTFSGLTIDNITPIQVTLADGAC